MADTAIDQRNLAIERDIRAARGSLACDLFEPLNKTFDETCANCLWHKDDHIKEGASC